MIKTIYVTPEGLKALANKTGTNFMIFILIFVENFCNTMLYTKFQYVSELVLLQWALVSFEVILINTICVWERGVFSGQEWICGKSLKKM